MMREILFRGQTRRKGQKVRLDGTPVDSNWVEGYGVCMGKGDFSVIYSGDHVEKYAVYTDTVGQFTGLTDKNGKRIFEGDIVKAPFCGRKLHIFTVQYLCDGFYAVPADHDDTRLWKYRMECEHQNMRIIGNIHDDPELMEVEHD